MARPPSYVSIPDKPGIFRIDERESLYYELRGSAASSTKAGNDLGGATDKEPSKKGGRRVVLVMGARCAGWIFWRTSSRRKATRS